MPVKELARRYRAAADPVARALAVRLATGLRRIAWYSTDKRMLSVQWAFELSPNDGGTRLVQRSRWQPTNAFGRLIFSVMRKRQIPKENRQGLDRIKAILES